ncbi:MAG: sodium:proton exchanger [Marinilabiliales bacterium]|nr:MAG: sodium:proton exchanger [Marinilabiliales bacterium]
MIALDNPYVLIIAASIIVIVSYGFNSLNRARNIPSVLLLILFGILVQVGFKIADIKIPDLFGILEVLGIVGLIMIVLEGALDLELKKEKWPIIWKSFSVALLGLASCIFAIGYLLQYLLNIDLFTAVLYAIPISIVSSAIVIPSVSNLSEKKREFMIYESTFSDIIGIMVFYFLLGSLEAETASEISWSIVSNVLITVGISLVISYSLIFVFQNLTSQIKLFLLISVLLLLYSVGKMFHLSSLIIILIFGLVLHNHKVFFKGFLKKYKKDIEIVSMIKNFKMVTAETSFIVRTFFFVIFGITITLSSLIDFKVLLTSLAILAIIFGLRFVLIKLFLWKDIFPEAIIAPRGLITILLFFAIPEEFVIQEFESGILLYIILLSSLIMAIAMIKKSSNKVNDELEQLIEEDTTTNNLTND